MDETIQVVLDQIESERGVRILYAVESGSRAWGFASQDSDYDVRFVYALSVKDYLVVNPPKDVIELPVTEVLDVHGWDLFKALQLFRKSNPPLLEWLSSPIVYRERGGFAESLRALAPTHTSARRMMYHYLNMARNAYAAIEGREEVAAKKYLYALRPLVCIHWIEQRASPPPTSIWEGLAGASLAHDARARLSELLARKRNLGELGTIPADAVLNGFIAEEIGRITAVVATALDVGMDAAPLNALAWRELGLE
ncbi:MAG TPA: nucleotidyltransferase domain-containing protein [Chthonomonadaceae bacterium]|nr:nucleotidyltransferase domain-containing protein [Chthonomonadaceae bacterium]